MTFEIHGPLSPKSIFLMSPILSPIKNGLSPKDSDVLFAALAVLGCVCVCVHAHFSYIFF